jgi:hypothetical protein
MSFASFEGDVGREASLLTPVVSSTEEVAEEPESLLDVIEDPSSMGEGARAGAFAALSAGES